MTGIAVALHFYFLIILFVCVYLNYISSATFTESFYFIYLYLFLESDLPSLKVVDMLSDVGSSIAHRKPQQALHQRSSSLPCLPSDLVRYASFTKVSNLFGNFGIFMHLNVCNMVTSLYNGQHADKLQVFIRDVCFM